MVVARIISFRRVWPNFLHYRHLRRRPYESWWAMATPLTMIRCPLRSLSQFKVTTLGWICTIYPSAVPILYYGFNGHTLTMTFTHMGLPITLHPPPPQPQPIKLKDLPRPRAFLLCSILPPPRLHLHPLHPTSLPLHSSPQC